MHYWSLLSQILIFVILLSEYTIRLRHIKSDFIILCKITQLPLTDNPLFHSLRSNHQRLEFQAQFTAFYLLVKPSADVKYFTVYLDFLKPHRYSWCLFFSCNLFSEILQNQKYLKLLVMNNFLELKLREVFRTSCNGLIYFHYSYWNEISFL